MHRDPTLADSMKRLEGLRDAFDAAYFPACETGDADKCGEAMMIARQFINAVFGVPDRDYKVPPGVRKCILT
jgi:hypothetical protein